MMKKKRKLNQKCYLKKLQDNKNEKKDFRDRLVASFHRRWSLKDIVWPSRTGEMQPKIN